MVNNFTNEYLHLDLEWMDRGRARVGLIYPKSSFELCGKRGQAFWYQDLPPLLRSTHVGAGCRLSWTRRKDRKFCHVLPTLPRTSGQMGTKKKFA